MADSGSPAANILLVCPLKFSHISNVYAVPRDFSFVEFPYLMLSQNEHYYGVCWVKGHSSVWKPDLDFSLFLCNFSDISRLYDEFHVLRTRRDLETGARGRARSKVMGFLKPDTSILLAFQCNFSQMSNSFRRVLMMVSWITILLKWIFCSLSIKLSSQV